MNRAKALELASKPIEVLANVKRYENDLRSSDELRGRIGYVRAWYAVRGEAGLWLFGPSKFIGYRDNSARRYLDHAEKGGGDGRDTERVLAQWFREVDLASRLGQELAEALRKFLAPYGVPNARARISVSNDEPALAGMQLPGRTDLAARIVSDPDICGGRPCIRGTRMRVSDLLEMLAAGASREEIVQDFPYIGDEDISAALGFAAKSASHRIIRAA